jgi:hypothetical protein
MRAIRFEGAGQADVIKLLEEPLPQLRPHDLLVRVHAAERKTNLSPVMETLEYTSDVDGRTKCSCMLQADQNSLGSDMRALFAILGLLLCLIATRADELPVIKDSEAIHYVGKKVEVRGFVSVTTSPLGTAFINFGREYPNQTFAGFIAAGSKIATDQRIATLQGKIIGITGTIEIHKEKPEIKVILIAQIKFLGPHLVQ